ncbi:MAG: histidine kinase [Bacteroidetes bacterium]|nr:histidine kinase [Bacteroidota bacterium]
MLKYFLFICFFYLSTQCAAQFCSGNYCYEEIDTKQGLSNNIVLSLLQDSEGYLWIGTYNGLCMYNGTKFTKMQNVLGESDQNVVNAIETIFEDKRKNIWIGTRYGLVSRYTKKEKRFYIYPNTINAAITGFFQDKKGTIWVTNDKGMIGSITGDKINFYPITVDENILSVAEKTDDMLIIVCAVKSYVFSKLNRTAAIIRYNGEKAYNYNSAIATRDADVFTVNQKGCNLINIKENTIKTIIPTPSFFRSPSHQKIALGNNTIYYTDGVIMGEYTLQGKHISTFSINELGHKNNTEINTMISDKSGIIWLGTNSGLLKIDKYKYQFDKYMSNGISKYITHDYVRSIYTDKQGNLWIGMRNGAVNKLCYNRSNNQYDFSGSYRLHYCNKNLSEYTVNCFLQLRNGKLLVGGQQGVSCLKHNSNIFTKYLPDSINTRIVEVWSLYEDAYGNIWIGCNNLGLFIYNPRLKRVYHYMNNPSDKNTIAGNSVWNIYESKNGHIWLGTSNGLCFPQQFCGVQNLNFKQCLLNDTKPIQVWSISEDRDSNLWIGTTGNGLYSVSLRTNKINHFNNLVNNVVASVFFDKKETIWVSTVNGLYHYDKKINLLNSFGEQDGLQSSDFNFKAYSVAANNKVFLGTKSGIVSFSPDSIKTRNYNHIPVYITSLKISGVDSSCAISRHSIINLSYKQNFINIGFAIVDFTKPETHTYRYKLEGFQKKWTYTTADQPYANYTNIPPGKYKFLLEGSVNGNDWNSQSQFLFIDIHPALWQRPIFWLVLCITIVTAVSLFVYKRIKHIIKKEREKNKIQLEIVTLELNALQAQMNPHFIFNTLNAIQHYIINHDDIAANNYLSRFAKLMRLFLESSKNKYTNLQAEIELNELYISLERLRFEDKFDYSVTIDHKINVNGIRIPSMLIQPFIENAIKHGLIYKQTKGILKLSFFISDDQEYILCEIDDNGIGREKSKQLHNKNEKYNAHASRGMQLIRERVDAYNFIEKRKIGIEVIDKHYPEEGTLIKLKIPVS